MRFALLLSFLVLSSSDLLSQKNFFSGTWETYSDEFHAVNPTGRIIVDNMGTAKWDHADGFFLSEEKSKNSGCDYSESSLNNYSSFTLSLAVECASSDTVNTFNLTSISIGSPLYLIGISLHLKSLKTNSDLNLNCFSRGDCFADNFSSYLRKPSLRTIEGEDLFVGSSTVDYIEFEEVRFTDSSIEVVLLFNERSESSAGTLHAPGEEFAYFLRDSKGNRYDLISQYGWEGNQKNNFGSYTFSEDEEQHLILFFEPAKNPPSVTNLSLLEGECETSCWNFYDIRLKDQ